MAILDDNSKKNGKLIHNVEIKNPKEINHLSHDGILISSFNNRKDILDKLIKMKYNYKKIISIFD